MDSITNIGFDYSKNLDIYDLDLEVSKHSTDGKIDYKSFQDCSNSCMINTCGTCTTGW